MIAASQLVPARRITSIRPARALALPLLFALALASVCLLPPARANMRLVMSIAVALTGLVAWAITLAISCRLKGRTLTLEIVLRKQHYLQAIAQGTVLLYWGWYWRPVYDWLPLVAAQLFFAYAFDALLVWSRRETYTLGFGPFPVVFSTNLFLWFKPDWFYLQFLMLAIGFTAKELIVWRKEGRLAHIFNPSSFPLAAFSLGLILTGTTAITWGVEIADTQFRPPHIYLALFLISLPGQLLFGVASMTMSAAVATYAFGLAYFAATGTYFFVDSYIPIAVFLGMNLLFTDPSTSPRTELGRIVYGVLYGLGTVACYALLGRVGVPTFYDKLLPVPVLNLMVKGIDSAARSQWLRRVDPGALGRTLAPRMRNLAYVAVWIVIFAGMTAAQGVGDTHRGHWVPFWIQACREHRRGACDTLAMIDATYCRDSGWACNDLGVLVAERRVARSQSEQMAFERSCGLGDRAGCQNARRLGGLADRSGPLVSDPPRLSDYRILLQEGKGPLDTRSPFDLYDRACAQGWMSGCESLAFAYLRGQGIERSPDRAAAEFDQACRNGTPTACSNLGLMFHHGDGVRRDDSRARAYLKRACTLGFADACQWLDAEFHASSQ